MNAEETDWQETALSNRHLHNRNSRRTTNQKSKALFNVRNICGTYSIKCPAAEKKALDPIDSGQNPPFHLEVYGPNDDGDAIFAELGLGKLICGVVVLAGSRKVLARVLEGLRVESGVHDIDGELDRDDGRGSRGTDTGHNYEVHDAEGRNTDDVDDNDDGKSDGEGDGDLDADSKALRAENERALAFEKNSFRSPKFWLKWQGHVRDPRKRIMSEDDHDKSYAEQDEGSLETNGGYLVFSGKTCDKFEGTLKCEAFGWDNVKIRGWKIATKPQRDFQMEWL